MLFKNLYWRATKLNNGQKHNNKIVILRGSSQYVTPSLYNVQEIGLAKSLVKQGWDVLIISSGPKENETRVSEKITWLELKRRGKRFGWPISAIQKIKAFSPDIIQLQDITNTATFQAIISKKINRTPLILSLGEYQSSSKINYLITKAFSIILHPYVSNVLCKTRSSIKFAKQLGFKNCILAPIGIDDTVYEKNFVTEPSWMKELKEYKKMGNKILCHAGRLDKQDNVPFILKTIEMLPEQYKLILIGEPREYAANLIGERLKSRVILTGRLPNKFIGIVFGFCDLYLACSKYEIFGMSAVESIYSGLPVLGYSTGGIKEIVQNKLTGWLLEKRDFNEWANKISDIFCQEENLNIVAKNCAQNSSMLTWNYRSILYQNTYERLINNRGYSN